MKFGTFILADVSTAHITQRDAELLESPDAPSRIAALDSLTGERGSPGFVLSIGNQADHEERIEVYRRVGFSEEFIAIISELVRQEVPYVQFDRDGSVVEGAPVFSW